MRGGGALARLLMCEGKRRFASWAAARRTRGGHIGRIEKGKLTTYHCPHCKWWHNGHHNQAALESFDEWRAADRRRRIEQMRLAERAELEV